jgi:hypothetical protein
VTPVSRATAAAHDVASLLDRALAPALTAGRSGLRWASEHSGLPVVVVAALTLVLAVRIAKRTWHIALEFAFALGLLLLATRLGWIRW